MTFQEVDALVNEAHEVLDKHTVGTTISLMDARHPDISRSIIIDIIAHAVAAISLVNAARGILVMPATSLDNVD